MDYNELKTQNAVRALKTFSFTFYDKSSDIEKTIIIEKEKVYKLLWIVKNDYENKIMLYLQDSDVILPIEFNDENFKAIISYE